MTHLIVCREYPPAPYPPGGIGTYVVHIARLLAEAGETVHIIAQLWEGAPQRVSESHGGKLVVHRVSLDEPLLLGLLQSDCPSQAFSWRAAQEIEALVEHEGIDLIEAQEWEAPLYYFQVRRAMGLGPRREPPCLVHLHSPTELIFRSSGWDVTLTDFVPTRRMEEYSIRAADALVSPSRYLAEGVRELYRLTDVDLSTIPYALGDTPRIERRAEVWARDAICYVGRLELRKGVVEWVDAAVEVARSHPYVSFEFIGSDTAEDGGGGRPVGDLLRERIPDAVRERFHFHASRPREKLREFLSEVPVAVVPSRWENFPFTCIEAMCTGMPVLVSPNGGMTELVRDGASGWVAADGTPTGLASALRRVLETPADQRAAMGRLAEETVRRVCGNRTILDSHLELRARLAQGSVDRSRRVPGKARAVTFGRKGLAVVVKDPQPGCLDSIAKQTRPARKVVGAEGGRTEAARQLLASEPSLLGVVLVDGSARLDPRYLEIAEAVFDRQPSVGVVASWIWRGESASNLDAVPMPISPTEHVDPDSLACVAVRAEALERDREWSAVTYPEALARLPLPQVLPAKRYSGLAMVLQRGSSRIALRWFLAAPMGEKIQWLKRAFKQPGRIGQWLAWQLRGHSGR